MVSSPAPLTRFNGDIERATAVYKGYNNLLTQDVADNVAYAATRYNPLLMQPAGRATNELTCQCAISVVAVHDCLPAPPVTVEDPGAFDFW